jgi:hypothetical protein
MTWRALSISPYSEGGCADGGGSTAEGEDEDIFDQADGANGVTLSEEMIIRSASKVWRRRVAPG